MNFVEQRTVKKKNQECGSKKFGVYITDVAADFEN
jgi:hypothetical protein